MKDTRKEETIRFLSLFIVLWLTVVLVAWLVGHGMKLERHPGDLTQYGLVLQGTVFLSAIFAALLTYWRTQEIRRRNDLQQDTLVLEELSRAISLLAEPNLVSQSTSLVQLARIWDIGPNHRQTIAQALEGFAKQNARNESDAIATIQMIRTFAARIYDWEPAYYFGIIGARDFRDNIGFSKLKAGTLLLNNSRFLGGRFTDCTLFELEPIGTNVFRGVAFERVTIGNLAMKEVDFELVFEDCTGRIRFGKDHFLDVSKDLTIRSTMELQSHLQKSQAASK